MREKTAVFIGHRDCYDLCQQNLQQAVEDCIKRGITTFLSGGQGGFDRAAAGVVCRLKPVYPHIQNHLVIPYLTFRVFNKDLFDQIIYPEGLEKYHYKAAIGRRNRYMVEQSAVAICYVRHPFGGAATTYRYAEAKKLERINL